MKKFLPLSLLTTALAMGFLAYAAQPLQAATRQEPLPDEDIVHVEINKGAMIKLDQPISSVVVADPATADIQVVSAKLIFVHGKKIGETSIYAVDEQDNMVFNATVEVTHNISQLERMVKKEVPDADVSFNTSQNGLVMDGFAGTQAESENIRNIASTFLGDKEKLVDLIHTAGSDQVMLKVKIVEMKRDDLKNIGINLQNITTSGNFGFQLLQGSNILFHPGNADITPDVFAGAAGTSVLDRGTSNNTNLLLRYRSLNTLVDALETQGMANVLAEPNLTTTSGSPASFLAGGQFPIPVVQSTTGGAPTITIQYQPFGVSLKFTPVVMSKNRISLTVAPSVSTLDFSNPISVSGVNYPILDTREASAVVELGSGDSFMLAGLLQNETSNTINKFPGLGDLPVLGALFRSTSFQNNETELAILVTPYIVHPVAENKLQTPLDGYKPPSDLQLLLQGNLYQQEPMKKEAELPSLHGDGGFMLQ